MELPYVIPSSIVQVINTLKSDADYQFQWKLSRILDTVALFVKCKIRAKTDDKVNSSIPVKHRKGKKKKSPSAKRRAAARQQRFQEKKAAEQATFPKPIVSAVTVPKELEPVPKEPEISSENSDQETADHSLLEPSSSTSHLTHLESQASGASLLAASLEEEQAILQDFAANLYSDDDFSDTGLCANCNREPPKGNELKRCARCHITRYCSIDCQRKD